MIIVTAYVTIKEGSKDKFMAAVQPCIDATRREEGNISYNLYASIEDDCKFTFVEEWESQEKLDAHMKSPHFQTFNDGMKEIAAAPLGIQLYDAKAL